jgi:hypothetical protein
MSSGALRPFDLAFDPGLLNSGRIVWGQGFPYEEIRSCPTSASLPCQSAILADRNTGVSSLGNVTIQGLSLAWENAVADEILGCNLSGTPCTPIVLADEETSNAADVQGIVLRGPTLYWISATELRSCNLLSGPLPCQSTLLGDRPTSNVWTTSLLFVQ